MFIQKLKFYSKYTLLILLVFFFSCEEKKLNLAFNIHNMSDQEYVLRSQMKVITSEDSTQPSVLNSLLKARVKSSLVMAYDDGSGRYQILPDSIYYTSDEISVDECYLIESYLLQQEFQFKMNTAGEMHDVSLTEMVPDLEHTDIDLRRLLLKIQPVLPAAPVYMGYTWERQHYFTEDEKKSFIYKWFEINDVYDRNQQKFVRIRMNVKYKVDELSEKQIKLTSDDFILGSGEILFNATAGVIVKANLDVSGVIQINSMPQTSNLGPMRVLQSISMESDF